MANGLQPGTSSVNINPAHGEPETCYSINSLFPANPRQITKQIHRWFFLTLCSWLIFGLNWRILLTR